MRVVIAGGSGFLGRALTRQLVAGGHHVTLLSRNDSNTPAGVDVVLWNPDGTADVWIRAIDGADAIVNLAGASIGGGRWTAARKADILDSRVKATRSLIAAVGACRRRPSVFVQGSAVGYYGATLDDRFIEESHPPADDFLGRVCVEWESAVMPALDFGCRLVVVRTGVVLSTHGGVLPPMTIPFRLFAGGPVGSGRQYLSWIHRDDWVALVAWAIGHTGLNGAFNATSPTPVTNDAFSRALAQALHRPNWIRTPAFVLNTLLGSEMAGSLVLQGQRVIPARASAAGFRFQFPLLDDALDDLISEA